MNEDIKNEAPEEAPESENPEEQNLTEDWHEELDRAWEAGRRQVKFSKRAPLAVLTMGAVLAGASLTIFWLS